MTDDRPLSITIGQQTIQLLCDTDLGRPIGTSFSFLRPQWVATAKHVVLENGLPRQHLVAEFDGGARSIAQVLACHPEIDIAILELQDATICKRPLFPAYTKFSGTPGLFAAGNRPSLRLRTGRSQIEVNHAKAFDFERRSRLASEEEVIVFRGDFVEPGHSGGPLLGEAGGVVGVVIETNSTADGTQARATSIISLLDGLIFVPEWRP